MVLNKLIKVIVEIAKLEWPEQQPDFFDRVFALCSNSKTAIHGLALLKTVSEEFVSVKEDLPSSRKRHLQQQLQTQLPHIMAFVHQVLKTLLVEFTRNNSIFTENINHSKDICIATLDTLMQYMGWMQVDKFLDLQLLDTLCQLTTVTLTHNQEICTFGVSCMIEISSKNYVPKEMERYLYQSFMLLTQLMQRILVNPENPQQMAVDLDHIEAELLEKFNLFIHGFVQNHMKQVETIPNFPTSQFFESLFQYSTLQSDPEDFIAMLDIWQSLLFYLTSSKDLICKEAHAALLNKYKQGLLALLEYLCKRSQFTVMGDGYLIDVEQHPRNSSTESELDLYLDQCLECIGMIADLFPLDTLNTISIKYQQLIKTFQDATRANAMPKFRDAVPKLQIIESTQHRQAFYLCKDIKWFMCIFARVSFLLTESFQTFAQATSSLLHQFISTAEMALSRGFQHNGSVYVELIQETFLSLQMYQHWMQHLYSTQSDNNNNNNTQEEAQQFDQLISGMLRICVQALDPSVKVPPRVAQEAASLFHKLAVQVVRSNAIFSYEPFQVLYQNIGTLFLSYASSTDIEHSSTVAILSKLCVAFSSLILLADANTSPSQNASPHRPSASQKASAQEDKRKKYREFIQPLLVSPFMAILQRDDFVQQGHQNREVMKQMELYLNLLTAVVASTEQFPKDSKLIVQENVQGIQGSMLNLFKLYISNATMLEALLQFFQSMFDSMRAHLGHEFIAKTVESFLELISSSGNMNNIINDSNGRGKRVVVQFLNLQKALCAEGSKRFVELIPHFIHVNRVVLYPLITNHAHQTEPGRSTHLDDLITEIGPIYFDVIFNMLLNSWSNYFFTLQQAPRSDRSLVDFQFLLQCFLESLQSSDINTVKQSLKHLEDLNTYKKLFSREVFIKTMFMSFLKVLFDVLRQRTHTLLTDELCGLCFEIARCVWQPFVDHFLPQYLAQSTQLNDQQRSQLRDLFIVSSDNSNQTDASKDVPIFQLRVTDFVNDYNWMSTSVKQDNM